MLWFSTYASHTHPRWAPFTEDLVLTNTPLAPKRRRLHSEEELPCQTKGRRDKFRTRWKLHCWHGNHRMICMPRFDVWRVDSGERGEENRFDPAAARVLFILALVLLLFYSLSLSPPFIKRWLHDSEQGRSASNLCSVFPLSSSVHCLFVHMCMCVGLTGVLTNHTLILSVRQAVLFTCQYDGGLLLEQLHPNSL